MKSLLCQLCLLVIMSICSLCRENIGMPLKNFLSALYIEHIPFFWSVAGFWCVAQISNNTLLYENEKFKNCKNRMCDN
jgi:hypothetical protein